MATGTGKTLVAFQICWKLWNNDKNGWDVVEN
jgi:type I site-specific restriction endonuclease